MESFASTSRVALRENLLTAALVLVAVPAALYFVKGEKNPAVLAGFAVGAALLTLAVYSFRDAWIGRQVIEIDDEGLRVRGRRRDERIAWADLAGAVHTLRGGERWVLKRYAGKPVMVWMDGFDAAASARIADRIRARLPGADRNPAAASS